MLLALSITVSSLLRALAEFCEVSDSPSFPLLEIEGLELLESFRKDLLLLFLFVVLSSASEALGVTGTANVAADSCTDGVAGETVSPVVAPVLDGGGGEALLLPVPLAVGAPGSSSLSL